MSKLNVAEDDNFWDAMDDLREHLEDCGLERACIIRDVDAAGNLRDRNVFDHFGQITETQLRADQAARRGAVNLARQWVIANPGLAVPHNPNVAIHQERGWIHAAVKQIVGKDERAAMRVYKDTIASDGIALIYCLHRKYVSTTKEALIIAENNLTTTALQLKSPDFDTDVKKWTAHIRKNVRILVAGGQAPSTQTIIAIYSELSSVENDDFKRIFGQMYDDWRMERPNTDGHTYSITQVLAKADQEFARVTLNNKKLTKENSEIIALQALLEAKMSAFQGEIAGLKEALTAANAATQKALTDKSRKDDDSAKDSKRGGSSEPKKKHWSQIPPKEGEPERKIAEGGSHYVEWCEKCRHWRGNHNTATHKKRSELNKKSEGGAAANNATLNAADFGFRV